MKKQQRNHRYRRKLPFPTEFFFFAFFRQIRQFSIRQKDKTSFYLVLYKEIETYMKLESISFLRIDKQIDRHHSLYYIRIHKETYMKFESISFCRTVNLSSSDSFGLAVAIRWKTTGTSLFQFSFFTGIKG